MIRSLTVHPGTSASKILFFDKIDFGELPDIHIVPLFGANGAGKTTLLTQIEMALMLRQHPEFGEKLDGMDAFAISFEKQRAGYKPAQVDVLVDERPTMYFRYRNSLDNFSKREMHGFDPFLMNARWDAQALSEGQSIVYSVTDLLKGMMPTTDKHESFVPDDNDGIVLLDEMDSGLSLDNLDACLRIIRQVVKKRDNIQFFLSFNNPYVLRYFPHVISLYDGRAVCLRDSAAMLDELSRNKKMLDKARKSRGRYKVF